MPLLLDKANNLKVKLAGAALFTVGITATLVNLPWLFTSRRNVESTVGQLNQEVLQGTSATIDDIFENVSAAKKFILDSYSDEFVDYSDFDQQTNFFISLVQANPNFNWVNFGYTNGDYFGVQRLAEEGLVRVHSRRWDENSLGQDFDPERAERYRLWAEEGIWDETVSPATRTVDEVDTRIDPWQFESQVREDQIYYAPIRPFYTVALPTPGEDAWTELYLFATDKVVGLDSSITFEQDGELVGVVSISFALQRISDYLETLDVASFGGVFIINSKREIVAFSNPNELAETMTGDDEPQLKTIDEFENALLRVAAYSLEQNNFTMDEVSSLEEPFLVRDPTTLRQYYVAFETIPYLDWTVGTVIPEAYFLTEINRNKRNLAFIIFGLVFSTGALAVLLGDRLLARPLIAISMAAGEIKGGNFDLAGLEQVGTRRDEFGQLARVFQDMARDVYSREQKLRQQVQDLTIEIDEAKRRQEVKEVTENEFFQDLQQKAELLRQRRRRSKSKDSEPTPEG